MYSSPMSAFRYIALLLVVTYTNLIQAQSQAPGYFTDFSTIPASNNTFSFGQHYAVLNLDLIVGLVAPLANTTEGAAFIDSTVKWQNAVHAQKPPPLSIYTRIYSLNSRHVEVAGGFAKVFGFQPGTIDDPNTQLYPPFVPIPDYDVDLKKIRYYAGTANELELILSSQKIDTVVLSGIRTSGVILSTTYRLFDLNYNVYVITNNSIETPPTGPLVDKAIKTGVIPKLPANVITVEQALAALERSGPAIY